jgi:type VII secretion protein EccB
VPSRQDQLHSYQYSLQRVVAALVTHDPDPSRSPLRRAGTTALVSLLIAAIAVGAAGLYGIFTGQNTVDPDDPTVVFQEKGTGARFVYLQSDGKLHPVLNYSSGLLLSSGQTPKLVSVASDKLAKVQLGAPLGIPNAPDSLPATGDLITDRWSVCTDNNGPGANPESTLLVGDRLTDGTVAAKADKALLVVDPGQNIFLVYGNRRFQVPEIGFDNTLRALGYGPQTPWKVSAAWINAVPAGPDLRAPAVPQSGGSAVVDDYRVGQLVKNSTEGFGVIMPDGIASVTPLQARLLQTAAGGAALDIGADFVKLPGSRTKLSDANDPNGLPQNVPALFTDAPTRVCMTLPVDPGTGDGVRVDPNPPTGVAVAGVPAAAETNRADLVHVARGRGAVVVASASATAPPGSGTVGVVTDTGRLYTLAGGDLLTKLGYSGVKPQNVPSQLVSLLPRGPSLDPAQARRTDPQG